MATQFPPIYVNNPLLDRPSTHTVLVEAHVRRHAVDWRADLLETRWHTLWSSIKPRRRIPGKPRRWRSTLLLLRTLEDVDVVRETKSRRRRRTGRRRQLVEVRRELLLWNLHWWQVRVSTHPAARTWYLLLRHRRRWFRELLLTTELLLLLLLLQEDGMLIMHTETRWSTLLTATHSLLRVHLLRLLLLIVPHKLLLEVPRRLRWPSWLRGLWLLRHRRGVL